MKTIAAVLNRPTFLFCALFMAAISCPSARAVVPERVTYQGNLRESGLLVTGSRSMTFRLYDAPAAGTLLWASGATAVSVSTGVFRAVLTPSGLNWESALWLEVEVAGTVLSPREELTAAPFAANALLHSGKKYTNAAAAPASPGVGDLWFDTGTSALKFWSGLGWVSTAGSGATHAATHAGAGADPITGLGAYTLTGNITMSPGTNLAAGAGSPGVSVSTHLIVSGAINPASNLTVGGSGFSVAFASAVTAGWFYGNGAGLTNISAAGPANMATTDTAQTITGAKTFSAAPSVTAAGGLSVTYGVSAGSAAFSSGVTASSGTFTATGSGQFSLQTSSGINVLGTGGVTAAFFAGSGAALTGVAGPANMATMDTVQTITGAKTFSASTGFSVSYGLAAGSATLTGGLTASSGTFTASGPGQYSLSLSSGINAPAGTINAGLFVGNGAGLMNVSDTFRVAKAGDFMGGQLTTASTITVLGNAFSVGGSSFTVSGGSAAVAYGMTAGSFAGVGTALTNLTAASLTGALPAISGAALTNLPSTEANTYTSSKTFTSAMESAGFTARGQATVTSTMTVAGNAFSVGLTTFVVAGGNVGIGTTGPATLLDVAGAAQFGSGATKSTFSATGALTMASGAAITGNVTGSASLNVLKGGDTMTGALVLPADPTTALQAAPKQYVDSWSRPCVNPGDAGDIMVPVGDLCVDKYETSVWSTATGGTQYGINGAADYPAACGNGATGTGQGCAAGAGKIWARSVVGVKPSTSITWFQANIACANAGKHLLTNAEWQAAAAGTADPGALAQDVGPACNTSGTQSMTAGNGTSCLSSYGVENMIGSVWEWVADWGQYGQISQAAYTAWADGTFTNTHLPAGYNADGSWNVAGKSYNGTAWVNGLPAAVIRGGRWVNGASAGVFAFYADYGPSSVGNSVGFRCGRRR